MARDDTRLTEWLLGILDKQAGEQVERERQDSAEAREALSELEELLGNVALAAEPRTPSPGVRERLLESLLPEMRFEGFKERLATLFDLSIERVRELLDTLDSVSGEPWEKAGLPGVHLLHFDGGLRVASADCGLVHVEPGQAFPPHRHLGHEWVLVLQGEAREDSGRLFQPGDLIHKAPGSVHSFRILGEQPFVFAVVVFEGVAWKKV